MMICIFKHNSYQYNWYYHNLISDWVLSINNVTQIWITFDMTNPIVMVFITKALVLMSKNPLYPLLPTHGRGVARGSSCPHHFRRNSMFLRQKVCLAPPLGKKSADVHAVTSFMDDPLLQTCNHTTNIMLAKLRNVFSTYVQCKRFHWKNN